MHSTLFVTLPQAHVRVPGRLLRVGECATEPGAAQARDQRVLALGLSPLVRLHFPGEHERSRAPLTGWTRPAEYGQAVEAGKERPPMTEQNQARDLVATLRDALHQLEGTLERTRDGVDEIASQAERMRDSVAALCDLWQREDTSVGIEMFVDAAVDLLEAFRALASGILDVQTEVETLAAEIESREMLGAMPPQASPPPQDPCPDTSA